jgi:LemA protein
MKRNLTLWIVLGIILILVFVGCGQYNGMVKEDENVKNAWGNVQSAYQRRADLIPNLVSTVQGEAEFERGTLTDVINARANATAVRVDPTELSPEQLQKFQAAQGQLSQALGRLLVVTENYPNLRANEAFRNLQYELSGTENRINTERNRFNGIVNSYNTKVRSFPNNLFAGMYGFRARPPFEADPGAQNAPRVNFPSRTSNTNTTIPQTRTSTDTVNSR